LLAYACKSLWTETDESSSRDLLLFYRASQTRKYYYNKETVLYATGYTLYNFKTHTLTSLLINARFVTTSTHEVILRQTRLVAGHACRTDDRQQNTVTSIDAIPRKWKKKTWKTQEVLV